MNAYRAVVVFTGRLLRRKSVGLLLLGALLVLTQSSGNAQPPPPDALPFFNNYFVTGDYRVGSVDLTNPVNNFAEGTIHFNPSVGNAIPSGSDVLAAFLYIEMISEGAPDLTGSTFRGNDISALGKQVGATQTLDQETSPCWTGGPNDVFNIRSFRFDVLRFLHVPPTSINDGRRIVNDSDYAAAAALDPTVVPLTVRFPESNGNHVPSVAGTSLLVIYKDRDPAKPLKAITVYNGSHVQTKNAATHVIDTLTQRLKGFYQLTASPDARTTLMAGSGSSNSTERLFFGEDYASLTSPIATDVFPGLGSSGSDRKWDAPTFPNSNSPAPLPITGSDGEVALKIDHTANSPYDCIHLVAIAFSGNAQDQDGDGYLDVWEENAEVFDPNGELQPNLYAMGARKNKKNLLVEFAWAEAPAGTTYGIDPALKVVVNSAHDHRPSGLAIKAVGDAFKNAPVSNPDGTQGIKALFDLGDGFPSDSQWNEYVIRDSPGLDLARGGETIEETGCVPYDHDGIASTPLVSCLFGGYPGTWGWKSAFKFLRDHPLQILVAPGSPPPAPTELNCVAAETDNNGDTTCIRRFDRNRINTFRFSLWGHAIALPRFNDAGAHLVDPPGSLAPGGPLLAPMCDGVMSPGTCTGSYIPRNVTGVADGGGSGGGDTMITLGPFAGHSGNGGDHSQGATLLHELGHTLRLRHGAVLGPGGIAVPEPNCKPLYQSSMNYRYQLTGLTVPTGPLAGKLLIDFSRQALSVPGTSGPKLNENSLRESVGLGAMAYLPRWYSPTVENPGLSDAVTRHCDGTRRTPQEVAANVSMFSIQGTSLTGAIDWNADGSTPAGLVGPQDINFNGGPNSLLATPTSTDGPFSGFNDWAYVDLRQVGSRRNVASPAGGDLEGPLSLDQGVGDNGVGDNGVGDNGVGDNGVGDNGVGDNGVGDNGVGDNGVGDNGVGDNGEPAGEIDLETALATGAGAASGLTITLTTSPQRVLLNWSAPPTAQAFRIVLYDIYRFPAGTVGNPTKIGTVVGTGGQPPATTFLDPENPRRRTTYSYFVISESEGPPPSNETVRSPRSGVAVIAIP